MAAVDLGRLDVVHVVLEPVGAVLADSGVGAQYGVLCTFSATMKVNERIYR